MDLAVLGPLRARVGDNWIPITSPKQRLILGVLAARRRHAVSTDELLDIVWMGQPPAGGFKTLRYHVSKLRDVVDPGRTRGAAGPIRTVESGYLLDIEPEAFDVDRFERLAGEGGRLFLNGSLEQAQRVLDEALGLWRGEAWADFRFDDFAVPFISRVDELRLAALENRIEARLGLGERAELVVELRELTARHPLHERFWAQLMVALHGAGNAGEAVETYRRASAVLGDELDIEPNPILRRLKEQIINRSLPVGPIPAAGRRDGLPARSSSFVGRELEIARLVDLLGRRRLVTLTGPGGVGKTSIAMEALRLLTDASDDITVVDLSTTEDPDDVILHVARGLRAVRMPGRPMVDSLVERIGDGNNVLLIDNCEHLRAGVATTVTKLLEGANGLRVLATSRTPLHIAGEHTFPVEPLPVPERDDTEAVASSDAGRLFVDRVAAVRGEFTIDEHTSRPVAVICRKLDGLPLALELAAARLRVLTVEELLDRMERPFDLLADGRRRQERHRTLWATLEWSYDLLSPAARTVLARSSVLRGVFDLDAIQAVIADGDDDANLLPLLEELVDASLLVRRYGSDDGFRFLETIRKFASHHLDQSGEEPDVQARHARHFAELAVRRLEPGAIESFGKVADVHSESENRSAALDWTLANGHADLSIRLAAGMALDWYALPRSEDALRRLVAVADQAEGAASPEYAEALRELGLSLPWIGRVDEARVIAQRLDDVAARLPGTDAEVDALWVHAAIATVTGHVAESRDLFQRGSSLLRSINHPRLTTFLFDLAVRELALGNRARAAELADELEAESLVRRQPVSSARVTLIRGLIAYNTGDVNVALARLTRGLADMRASGLVGPQLDALRFICEVAVMADRWELVEWAATDYRSLLERNGEVVGLPAARFAQGSMSLARGDTGRAADQVRDGFIIIRRTATTLFLDDGLLVAARIAVAMQRAGLAVELLDARQRRRLTGGVVDPRPVARLIERTSSGLPVSGSLSAPDDWRRLTDQVVGALRSD